MGKVGSGCQGRLQGTGGHFPPPPFCSDSVCLSVCLCCPDFRPCSLSGSIVSPRDALRQPTLLLRDQLWAACVY